MMAFSVAKQLSLKGRLDYCLGGVTGSSEGMPGQRPCEIMGGRKGISCFAMPSGFCFRQRDLACRRPQDSGNDMLVARRFRPGEPTTRAEMACMVYNALMARNGQ